MGRIRRTPPCGPPWRATRPYCPPGDGVAEGAADGVPAGEAGGAGLPATGEAVAAGAGPWTESRTELLCGLRMESARLVTMKSPARIVVAPDSTLAGPRGPNAGCVPPPPKAPARALPLPGCRRTTPIRKRHEIRWSATTR